MRIDAKKGTLGFETCTSLIMSGKGRIFVTINNFCSFKEYWTTYEELKSQLSL